MTSNLSLWNKMKRVPPEHLKGFNRPGGFSGTAIKPMWAIQRMTEEFGPCGVGWGINEPSFNVQTAGNEILVYCTVTVWYAPPEGSKPVYNQMTLGGGHSLVVGVGGDKIMSVTKNGPRTDDEAFKKAFTDAVTNALKFIGTGADVHMGLFDGSKYIDEKPKAADADIGGDDHRPAESDLSSVEGNPGLSKAGARELFKTFCAEIRAHTTEPGLKKWGMTRKADIQTKMPAEWVGELEGVYRDQLDAIKKRGAA